MSPTPRRKASPDTGAALVLTLGMLVLLSGLVLALLLTVRTEYGSAKAYEGGTNARLLADSALNLVIGQIREASTQPDLAWISQPGLMRTFNTSGKVVKCYKLYSADSLVEDATFDPAKATDIPGVFPTTDARNWKKQPGLWTDLNSPVADLTRTDPFDSTKKLMIYPIFDGNHINSSGQMSLNKTDADIEGFTVDNYATSQVTMPVKWLYLLKDGTLVPAKRSGTAGDVEVLVPVGKEKTAQGEVNSPVARVAFWTDDETAKVNINTASEGTFWDTPVGNSQPGVSLPAVNYKSSNDAMFEWDLAERQGAQKEYQRYPGHPATTCLSTIFGRQLLLRTEVSNDRAKMAEQIFTFIPRVSGAHYADPAYTSVDYDYSSTAGTTRAGPKQGQGAIGQSASDETTYPITPDNDRLYASLDEFLYNPNFGSGTSATMRSPWLLAPPQSSPRDTTREMLEMSKFFLTASSKAPEQNLFNQPRIAIWPEMLNLNGRTAFDKLIVFCSTVGPKSGTGSLPFYFTRQNANDPKADLSTRNLALMDYLKGLTDRAFPGGNTTKTFKDKYGADRDQILTEIFDYIRCTNLVDRSDPSVNSSYTNSVEGPLGTIPPAGDSYTGQFPPSFDSTYPMGPRGQVVPIEMPDGTRGMGRITTISELALIMVKTPSGQVEFSLLPEEFCPMAGFSALSLGLRMTFTKIDIKVTDAKSNVLYPFYKDATNAGSGLAPQPTLYDIGRITEIEDHEIKLGGPMGFHGLCQETNGGRWPQNQGSPLDSVPPTGVASVDLSGNMTVGGTVTVEISAPAKPTPTNTTSEPIVQVITFKFPDQPVPVPTGGATMGQGVTGSNSRGPAINGTTAPNFMGGGTTVRSLVPVGKPLNAAVGLQGDMRLVAARHTVDPTYFASAPNGAYTDTARQNNRNNSMRYGWPGNAPGSAFGFLVSSIHNYGSESQPCLPDGIDGVMNSLGYPGDWDNGPAFVSDGPYCNKPDEGTKRHLHGAGSRNNYTEGTLWGNDYSAPYIGWGWNAQDAMQNQTTFFSPNRQIPSAVMFGSLPTGVLANKPWQTLLFRPAKSYFPGGETHPGSAKSGPPDHLLLDLFWMPVVEPYAISEPFATGGKVNLNQQIAPFTNIRRDTGLRAVLKSVKITAMNPDQGNYSQNYKTCGTPGNGGNAGGGQGVIVRRSIDLDNTLKQIADRWEKQNKPFVSASEICDIPLIPMDLPTASGPVSIPSHVKAGFDSNTSLTSFDSLLESFWGKHKLTGDNSLEKPYASIYPRLTTRSNSYTVHVRVQTLAQNSRNTSFILKAAQSQPTGEFRGSFLIERYLDANSAGFVDSTGKSVPNPGANTAGLALGPYRFRVVSSKQFVP